MKFSADDSSDKTLVNKFLRARSEEAFCALYRRHTPALYQLALRLVGWNASDAEEVVQEMWIAAVRALPDFRWQSKLRTWLTAILLNLCRDMVSRKTVLVDDAQQEHISLTQQQSNLDLERGIASLPEGYRMVLVLHDIEGYTHEEIGKMASIQPGTSKSQLFRAREALRAYLSESKEKHNERTKSEHAG